MSSSLILALRLFLCIIFVRSSLGKLTAQQSFAHAIGQYQLLPESMVSPIARILPWLELAVGVALGTGVALRIAAATCTVLLLVFTGAIGASLAKGQQIPCYCFGNKHAVISLTLLIRNVFLMLAALWLLIESPTQRMWYVPSQLSVDVRLLINATTLAPILGVLTMALCLTFLLDELSNPVAQTEVEDASKTVAHL